MVSALENKVNEMEQQMINLQESENREKETNVTLKSMNENLRNEMTTVKAENAVYDMRRKDSRKKMAILEKTNVVLLAEVKVLKDQATFYEEEKKEAQMQIAE